VFNRPADDWYSYLWARLVYGRASGDCDGLFRNVRVITFNYDRSLEARLFKAIRSTFPKSDAKQVLASLPIFHAYGRLAEGFEDFSDPLSADRIRKAINGIHVIPETRQDDPRWELIRRDFFDGAEQICFLGFGFDKLNLARLDVPSVLRNNRLSGKRVPMVFATVLGISTVEIQWAHRRTVGDEDEQTRCFKPLAAKCEAFLRETGILTAE
jgi:hypothetical protein